MPAPNTNEISKYRGEIASPVVVAKELVKLKIAFPAIESQFISVLSERLVQNNFTDQRVKDAISHIIDNFKYQRPSIADIVCFDKKIKLYSYSEVCLLVTENKASFDDFEMYDKARNLRVKKSEL